MIPSIQLTVNYLDKLSDAAHVAACSKEMRKSVSHLLEEKYGIDINQHNRFFPLFSRFHSSVPPLLDTEEEELYPEETDPRQDLADRYKDSVKEAMKTSLLYARIFPDSFSIAEKLAERLFDFYEDLTGWACLIREKIEWEENCSKAVDLLESKFRKHQLSFLQKDSLVELIFSACIRKEEVKTALRLVNGIFTQLISPSDKELLSCMTLRIQG